MSKKIIKVMNTAFRDGFQSVYGARVYTKDFIPAVEASRDAGITHFEAGGGARFQSLFFYCNENAFDMMDAFRKAAGPDANLQTLARGNNVVGLDSQSSDVIDLHAKMFKKHGMTTIRNFDALNDVNNLIYSGKCIAEAGLKHEVVVAMMGLPPNLKTDKHTPEFYIGVLKQILDSGVPFDSVCFKDASGTSIPAYVYETLKGARALLGTDAHIRFHSHDTAGCGITMYKAAIDGGADGLDLSMAPASHGTCQPDMVTMWHALRGTDFELDIDIDKVLVAEEVFKDCMKDYFLPPEALSVEPKIPFSPMPGGALTANTQMMRDNGIMDRYPEVITNMEEVVAKGGYGTSVTPVSQFYFQQAFNNTMFGPWEKIAEGYGKMVLGYFGKTPVAPDAEIVKLASEQLKLEPTTKTVLQINDADPKKGLTAAKKLLQANNLELTDENLFISATCKDKGITFLKGEAKTGVRKNIEKKTAPKAKDAEGYTVTVNNREYTVVLDGAQAVVNGKTYNIDVKEGVSGAKMAPGDKSKAGSSDSVAVKAPLPGTVVKILVKVGDSVTKGKIVMVIEAMKMETEIRAAADGVISGITATKGDQISAGQTLVTIN